MQNAIDLKIDEFQRFVSNVIAREQKLIEYFRDIISDANEKIEATVNNIEAMNYNLMEAKNKIEKIYERDGTVLGFDNWRVIWTDPDGYQHNER